MLMRELCDCSAVAWINPNRTSTGGSRNVNVSVQASRHLPLLSSAVGCNNKEVIKQLKPLGQSGLLGPRNRPRVSLP